MLRSTRLSNIRQRHLAVIPALAVLALVATSAHPATAQTPLTASFTARAIVIHNRCGFIGLFDASASSAPAGAPITQYAWNFGNGVSVVTTSPRAGISYTSGSYIVVLTVTDANGASARTSRAISGGSGSLYCR
jgi:hypothetical protein